MSNTYTIKCTDCVTSYDVGQTSNGVPYVYNDFEFLQYLIAHRGHNLLFTDEWGDVYNEKPSILLEKQVEIALDLIYKVFNFKKDYFVSHGEVFSVVNKKRVQFIRKATFKDEVADSVIGAISEELRLLKDLKC